MSNIKREFFLAYENVITSESFSNYVYKMPKNKQELIIDFYILNALPIWEIDDSIEGKENKSNKELAFIITENQNIINDYLQKHLLKVLLYAISSEFRHILDIFDVDDEDNKYKIKKIKMNLLNFAKQYNMQDFITFYMNYFKDNLFDDTDTDYNNSYRAIINSKINIIDFVNFAKECFKNDKLFKWHKTFIGGIAWIKICNTWIKLKNSNTKNDKLVWIDHVFDLEHNSGSIFNKLESYKIHNSYDWIKDILDFKRDAKDITELLKYASGSVKSFAAYVLKNSKTFEIQQEAVSNKYANIESSFKTPEQLKKHLKKNVVWIKFLKTTNGKNRVGKFTLITKYIKPSDIPKGLRKLPKYQVAMYELPQRRWRSCNFYNIDSIKNIIG